MSDGTVPGVPPSTRVPARAPRRDSIHPPAKRGRGDAVVDITFATTSSPMVTGREDGALPPPPSTPSPRRFPHVVLQRLCEGARAIGASIVGIIILTLVFTAVVNDMTIPQAIDLLVGGSL